MVSNTCILSPFVPLLPLVMLSLSKRVPSEHFAECVLRALATQAQDQRDGEISTSDIEAGEVVVAAPHVGMFILFPYLVSLWAL